MEKTEAKTEMKNGSKNGAKTESKSASKLPSEIEPQDFMVLEKLALREENIQLKIMSLQGAFETAQREHNEHKTMLRSKYGLGDTDTIDTVTRKITRKS